MESSLRLRLAFKDPEILTESQRTEGLKRAWVLVNQSHETIFQLSDYLTNVFELRDSCPNGLVLSMDGFVLPRFESLSIFKDRDLICVKRKRALSGIARLADERKCCEIEGAAAEQPVNGGMKLLANEEFEKESGGYRSESEDGEPEKLDDIEDSPKKTISKKRKATKKLNRSNDRKKRKKSATTEETLAEDVRNKIQKEQNGGSHQHALLLDKTHVEDDKSSGTNDDRAYSSDSDVEERKKNVNTRTPVEKRSDHIQENGKSNVRSSPVSNGSKMIPSRSTRRKKLKRQWLKEKQLREKEMQLGKLDNEKSSGKDNGKSVNEHQQPDESNDDEEGDIVPVVVRPGHIRFEPLSKADDGQTSQQYEASVETFQWNGITNKRKGQKWGKEQTGTYKRSGQQNLNQESSATPVVEEGTTVNAPIEFDKLTPCTTLPQVGDTVAYRLIELSSSWTPELSSFRVGKISKFNPGSDAITLVQVPEYPIVFEKDEDGVEESAAKSNMSLYGEDGSLELDYPSLADVRIVKRGTRATKSVSCIISRATAVDQGASSSWPSWPNSDKEPKSKKPSTGAQENGKENAWDEICDTLSAKKAQLAREDNWTQKASTPQSSWSYRGLRGSAIGPTMARLRAQKELS